MIDPVELRDALLEAIEEFPASIIHLDRETALDCYAVVQYLIEHDVARVWERDPREFEDVRVRRGGAS